MDDVFDVLRADHERIAAILDDLRGDPPSRGTRVTVPGSGSRSSWPARSTRPSRR
jgi:hypothetical protein